MPAQEHLQQVVHVCDVQSIHTYVLQKPQLYGAQHTIFIHKGGNSHIQVIP